MVERIISGGQTGVDRAALDFALERNIPYGGWCPKGRKAEDGIVPSFYPLEETPLGDYAQRTEWNVRDSDGTLIILHDQVEGGTKLAIQFCSTYNKPCFIFACRGTQLESVKAWFKENEIRCLNIGGPRESECPGIYLQSRRILRQILVYNK